MHSFRFIYVKWLKSTFSHKYDQVDQSWVLEVSMVGNVAELMIRKHIIKFNHQN